MEMSAPFLQILIATFGSDGLRRVAEMNPPKISGIEYIVSCQDPEEEIKNPSVFLPERSDMQLHMHGDKGLGLNRSHLLAHATAPYVLIADDDVIYYPEGLRRVLSILRENPRIDIFAFRYDGPDKKIYPPEIRDLAKPFKYYNPSAVELAFRREGLVEKKLDFSPLLGVGAPYLTAAEESILLSKALKSGLKGCYFPVTILLHPQESTGFHTLPAPGIIRSQGAYIASRFDLPEAILRSLMYAWRSPVSFPKALRYLVEGYFYARRHGII